MLRAALLGLSVWALLLPTPAAADCARLRGSYRIDWNTHTVLNVGATRDQPCILETIFVFTGAGTANTIDSLMITRGPKNGQAAVEGPVIRYTPRSGFVGTDEISYQVAGKYYGRPALATATARFHVR